MLMLLIAGSAGTAKKIILHVTLLITSYSINDKLTWIIIIIIIPSYISHHGDMSLYRHQFMLIFKPVHGRAPVL